MKKFKPLPIRERPREKLQQKGARSLSDLELLAILLGSGTKNSDVMALAGRILKVLDKSSRAVLIERPVSISQRAFGRVYRKMLRQQIPVLPAAKRGTTPDHRC